MAIYKSAFCIILYILQLFLNYHYYYYYYFYIYHIIRKSECDELRSEVNAKAALEDVGYNADLYIAIQEDNTQD